jgi:hypothetical protein
MPSTSSSLNTATYPRVPHITRALNLDTTFRMPGQHSSSIHSALRTEIDFAKEEGKQLRDWLNLYNFKESDFTNSSDLKFDPILAAGIVIYGLKLGLPFQFLKSNIKTLCSEKFDPHELTEIEDSRLVKLAVVTVLDHAITENLRGRCREIVFESIRSCPDSQDAAIEAACYSALLSFLNERKEIISQDTIQKIRGTDQERILAIESIKARAPELVKASPKSESLTPLDLSGIDIQKLLKSSDSDYTHSASLLIAERVDSYCRHFIINHNEYLPHLLPQQQEMQEAAKYFLERPAKLRKLYNSAIRALVEALELKSPQGFHDHDRRHLLFAVPATALKLAHDQDNYTQIFGLFCCLLHDAGRIVEAGFKYDDPRRKDIVKIHPQVSAALAADILNSFPEIPTKVRNETLLAIALHDSGQITNSCLSVFTQSADRLQLIGPEYLIRCLGYICALQDKPIYPCADQDPFSYGTHLLGCVSFYLHRLYPNQHCIDQLESRLAITSATFLMLASGLDNPEAYLETGVVPKSEWPALKHNLKRRSQRSFGHWINGHSREWSTIRRSFSEPQSAETYINQIMSLPLISDFNWKIGERHVGQTLLKQLEIAVRSNPNILLALEYLSKAANAYNRELSDAILYAEQKALKIFASSLSKNVNFIPSHNNLAS